jgi:hypothetical protein
MEHRSPDAFAEANLDYSIKLAIARGLQQQLSSVLTDPMPASLQRLVDALEAATKARRDA